MRSIWHKAQFIGLLLFVVSILFNGCAKKSTNFEIAILPKNPIVIGVDNYAGETLICSKPWTFFSFTFSNNSERTVTVLAIQVISSKGRDKYEAGGVFGSFDKGSISTTEVPAHDSVNGSVSCLGALNIDQSRLDADNAVETYEVRLVGYDGEQGCTGIRPDKATGVDPNTNPDTSTPQNAEYKGKCKCDGGLTFNSSTGEYETGTSNCTDKSDTGTYRASQAYLCTCTQIPSRRVLATKTFTTR